SSRGATSCCDRRKGCHCWQSPRRRSKAVLLSQLCLSTGIAGVICSRMRFDTSPSVIRESSCGVRMTITNPPSSVRWLRGSRCVRAETPRQVWTVCPPALSSTSMCRGRIPCRPGRARRRSRAEPPCSPRPCAIEPGTIRSPTPCTSDRRGTGTRNVTLASEYFAGRYWPPYVHRRPSEDPRFISDTARTVHFAGMATRSALVSLQTRFLLRPGEPAVEQLFSLIEEQDPRDEAGGGIHAGAARVLRGDLDAWDWLHSIVQHP